MWGSVPSHTLRPGAGPGLTGASPWISAAPGRTKTPRDLRRVARWASTHRSLTPQSRGAAVRPGPRAALRWNPLLDTKGGGLPGLWRPSPDGGCTSGGARRYSGRRRGTSSLRGSPTAQTLHLRFCPFCPGYSNHVHSLPLLHLWTTEQSNPAGPTQPGRRAPAYANKHTPSPKGRPPAPRTPATARARARRSARLSRGGGLVSPQGRAAFPDSGGGGAPDVARATPLSRPTSSGPVGLSAPGSLNFFGFGAISQWKALWGEVAAHLS